MGAGKGGSTYLGRIVPDWYITCARCANGTHVGGGRHTAPEDARDLGWRRRRGEGWVCPRCLAAGAATRVGNLKVR
jgi:hypothetical protein